MISNVKVLKNIFPMFFHVGLIFPNTPLAAVFRSGSLLFLNLCPQKKNPKVPFKRADELSSLCGYMSDNM
jgi:hypothetical protein